MKRGLQNPNSIEAIREIKIEIANELGITDIEALHEEKNNIHNQEINKKLVDRARYNLIGFK